MSNYAPQPFRWTKPDGSPAACYTVGWYQAGLDPIPANLKPVYDSLSLQNQIQNPVELDQEGKANIVLGSGGYKRVVYDENGNAVDVLDNISIDQQSGADTGFTSNLTTLRALAAGAFSQVVTYGYEAAYDGCGFAYNWNPSDTRSDDGVFVITPAALPTAGRWNLVLTNNLSMRNAGDNGSKPDTGTYLTRMVNAINANYPGGVADVIFNSGNYKFAASATFPTSIKFIREAQALFAPATGATLTFLCERVSPATSEFITGSDGYGSVDLSQSLTPVMAEWFGVVGNGDPSFAAYNYSRLQNMVASGAKVSVFPSQSTYYTTTDPTITSPIIFASANISIPGSPDTILYSKGINTVTVTATNVVVKNLTVSTSFSAPGAALNVLSLIASGNVRGLVLQADSHVEGGAFITFIPGGSVSTTLKAAGRFPAIIGAGSFALPANALFNTGDSIRVTAYGTLVPTSGSMTYRCSFGSSFAVAGSQPENVGGVSAYKMTFEFVVNSLGTLSYVGEALLTEPVIASGPKSVLIGSGTISPNLSIANAISVVPLGASSFTQSLLTVEFFPV